MTRRIITTPNAPGGFPYSQAVIAGGLVFVSGQGPHTSDGSLGGVTIQEQTRQCLRNVEAILKPPAARCRTSSVPPSSCAIRSISRG